MKYLLDTNPCIQYLNGRSEPLRARIDSESTNSLAVCSVVKAELFYGAMRSNNPAQVLEWQRLFLNRFLSLLFDDEAASAYGDIRARLERQGTPIGSNDLMIAAIAVANGLTVVTRNVREFTRIPGLRSRIGK